MSDRADVGRNGDRAVALRVGEGARVDRVGSFIGGDRGSVRGNNRGLIARFGQDDVAAGQVVDGQLGRADDNLIAIVLGYSAEVEQSGAGRVVVDRIHDGVDHLAAHGGWRVERDRQFCIVERDRAAVAQETQLVVPSYRRDAVDFEGERIARGECEIAINAQGPRRLTWRDVAVQGDRRRGDIRSRMVTEGPAGDGQRIGERGRVDVDVAARRVADGDATETVGQVAEFVITQVQGPSTTAQADGGGRGKRFDGQCAGTLDYGKREKRVVASQCNGPAAGRPN